MKRILPLILCLSLLLGSLPLSAASAATPKPATRGSYPVPSFRAQPIWEKIERGIPLAISHKTDWRNFPEASILGINSCINMGVDVIEVDFHVTKDGVPVALHDDNLRRMTDADSLIYIHEITWAQAKKYSLEDGMGNQGTSYILTAEDAKVLNSLPTYVANVGTAKAGGTMPISRFDSILELVNKRALLLMDKVTTADSFAAAYVCAKEWDMLDYVVFKGNYTLADLTPWFAAGAALWNKKYPSQPITAQEVQTTMVFEYNNSYPSKIQLLLDAGIRVVGLAAGVNDSNEERIRTDLVPYCREKGIYLRCNTGDPSYMGANAKIDCEIGWADLFDIGYTGVMTDRPGPLVNYIQERYRIRPASDRIDAEHFSSFNFDTYGFSVPEDWNAGKNKTVTSLSTKDTLVYENIEFDGKENIFTAKTIGSNSKLSVYLDGTKPENLLATLTVNSTSYASSQAKISPIAPGKHTVYLKFSGSVGLDQFRFTKGLYFGFANERLARFRYQDKLYGSLNYDTGNWFPRPASMSAAVLNNTEGTLSINLTAGGNHYIQTGSTVSDRPLHYIPQEGDYFQMRLKISNATANDAATPMTIGLVYITPDREDFRYGDRVTQTVTQSQLNGEYFTLTMAMNDAFVTAEEISGLRLYFTNLAPVSGKTATITIDQVYIGQKEYLPQKDYLYFDFTDRDSDEMRYLTSLYGYRNFDNSPWFPRTATMRGIWNDPLQGTLLAHVTVGGNHYFQTGNSLTDRPLHYKPSQSDFLQMRLRIDHATAFDPALPLSIGIAYASSAKTDFYYNPLLRKDHPATVIDSGYFTVTVPMPDFFKEETDIQALRIYISNLAPGQEEARIEVDSFYIGPMESIPDPYDIDPYVDPALKLNHSLNLASDISVNYLVAKELLEGFDLSTVYLESSVDHYEGNTKVGTETYRIAPVEKGNYYYFTLNGLTAVRMKDSIRSFLYGFKDGLPYRSETDEYSIASYAYSQLSRAASPQSLKTLCADLLRYGAKAQIYKSYRMDSLADSTMTEEETAYLSDMENVPFGNTNMELSDLQSPTVLWAGKALNLESRVSLKFVFDPSGYTGDISTLGMQLRYTDIYGNAKLLVIEDPEIYNADKNLYSFTVDSLLAAELRSVLSVQIFSGLYPVSTTLQYSADTYPHNKTGSLLTLCKALLSYSDSARSYFQP